MFSAFLRPGKGRGDFAQFIKKPYTHTAFPSAYAYRNAGKTRDLLGEVFTLRSVGCVFRISFLAAVRDDGLELRKLYPEGGAGARFKMNGTRRFLYYCNRHGLFASPAPGYRPISRGAT